ncbi:MAG: hypothetical protein R3Y11_12285 [Pseudomonadota bacterium]
MPEFTGHTKLTKVRGSVAPEAPKEKPFSTIHQGQSTNALTKLRAVEGKNAVIDAITGTATIQSGDFTITIPQYEQLAGLKTSTYQLLDAITVALTEKGAKSPTVTIPLSNYMHRRALKDRKEAKNQVKADLEVLRQASITWEEKRGNATSSYSFVNIADSGEIKRNGDIVFTFGTTFYNILLGYPVMPYPDQLQSINNKKNPNSYYLLRKISEHKNMNVGKKNENTIAVATLLAVTPFIPSYDEVMSGNKNLTDRIVSPLERDLDALSETLSWHYAHSNDRPLTDEELASMNYDIFKSLMVCTKWNTYPDQSARLERKAQRLEAAAAKKVKRSPVKKSVAGKKKGIDDIHSLLFP